MQDLYTVLVNMTSFFGSFINVVTDIEDEHVEEIV